MNERIKELILKAGFHPFVRGEQILFDISTEDNLKEFAELIVRECTSIIAKRKDIAIDGGWNVDEAMSMAAMDLEEYLGVER